MYNYIIPLVLLIGNFSYPLGLLIGNFSYPLGLYWLVLPPGYTRYPLESIVLEVGDHFFIFELDEPKNRKQRKQDNPCTYVNWWTPLTFWVPEENVPRYQRFSWQMVRQSIPKVYPTIITWLWRTYIHSSFRWWRTLVCRTSTEAFTDVCDEQLSHLQRSVQLYSWRNLVSSRTMLQN